MRARVTLRPKMAPDRITCPRCGESLPATLDCCDACGALLDPRGAGASSAAAASPQARARGHAPARSGPRPRSQGVPGLAWLFLVVGLAVGGMVGFALHSAIGPRGESGMPTGPADIMAGTPQGAPPRMPQQIMQQVQSYKAALAKNPDDLEANIGLGNLEFDSGQWENAIKYYSRALAIDPKNPDVRVDRAIAYHSSGRNDLAKTELLRVTREDPRHKNAWLNLGVVAREAGDAAGAARAWERYLELDPNGEHAAMVRQELASLKSAG